MYFVGNLKLKDTDTPGSESWSLKVRKRARTLVKVFDSGYLELGELLYTVSATKVNNDPKMPPVYEAWGYDSFAEYAESELQLHSRKAQHLRRIFYDLNQLDEAGLDRRVQRRLVELGWSKLREVIRVVEVGNAEQWVEMAENLPYTALLVALRKAREAAAQAKAEAAANGEEDADVPVDPVGLPKDFKELRKRVFDVFPGQADTIDKAMERAQQVTQSVIKGHNLEMICTDFLATNDFRLADDSETALRYLAKLERLTNKRLVVVDPKTLRVEYGIGVLEDMAAEED